MFLDELLGSTNTGLESQQSSVNSLSRASDTNLYVIYIHALHSGLFRVHMQVPASRYVQLTLNHCPPQLFTAIFRQLKLGLLTQFLASIDKKYL